MAAVLDDPELGRGPPRNRKLYDQGRELNAAIIEILRNHSPLAKPLTAKRINDMLSPDMQRSETTIQWHMRKIREHADTLRLPQFIVRTY